MGNYAIKCVQGFPTVIDQKTAQVVAGALVLKISFPSGQDDGLNGSVYYINGPGTGEIEVNGHRFTGVPLV